MRHAGPREREVCIRLYQEGLSLRKLSALCGRPRNTLCRWIREAGAKRGHVFREAVVQHDDHVKVYQRYWLIMQACGRPMAGDWCAV